MKKLLIRLGLCLLPLGSVGVSHAATQIYIPSTSTFNNYQINIGSGSIRNLQVQSSTFQWLNASSASIAKIDISTITNGTIGRAQLGAVFSTATWTFQSATINGTATDNSTTTKQGQFLAGDGLATAPKYSFVNDTNLGLYRVGSGVLGFTTAGVLKWRMESNGEFYSPNGNVIWGSDGLISAPGYGFFSETNSGIRRVSAGKVALTILGVDVATFTATGVSLKGTTAADSAPTGMIGEFISSATATSGVSVVTSGVYWDLISTFTLTAGDWELWGQSILSSNGATFTSVQNELCIGTVAGNNATGCSDGQNYFYNSSAVPTTFVHSPLYVPPFRVSIAANTNYYLKFYAATITSGSAKARGSLFARRIR